MFNGVSPQRTAPVFFYSPRSCWKGLSEVAGRGTPEHREDSTASVSLKDRRVRIQAGCERGGMGRRHHRRRFGGQEHRISVQSELKTRPLSGPTVDAAKRASHTDPQQTARRGLLSSEQTRALVGESLGLFVVERGTF